MQSAEIDELIKHYCANDDLSTYDPYDIWSTKAGFYFKNLFNSNRLVAIPFAGLLSLFDTFVNNKHRLFYTKKDYPIVRSWAALCLLNIYDEDKNAWALDEAKKQLEWLTENSSKGYSGYCWGAGFRYPVLKDVIYEADLPLATITPYALEVFVRYYEITKSEQSKEAIRSIINFFDKDLQVISETETCLVTSYSTNKDREVVNAVSYTMYSLSLGKKYFDENEFSPIEKKVKKLFNYIKKCQRADGSWLYSNSGKSFIDCFHTCIVIKNLVKTSNIMKLDGVDQIIDSAYSYLKLNFYDPDSHLFKRFSLSNKPSLVKFDLYDNSEALSLACLVGDTELVEKLLPAIENKFCNKDGIYSQIDIFNIRRNRNTFRWALFPFLYALSEIRTPK